MGRKNKNEQTKKLGFSFAYDILAFRKGNNFFQKSKLMYIEKS